MTTDPHDPQAFNPGDAILKTSQMGDIVAQRGKWLHSIRNNLAVINKSKDITYLNNLFQGLPGIVVGAGPSLQKNIDLLAERAAQYPLFCTDRAFAMLQEKGVIPEFTVAVDFQDIVADFFKGMPVHKSILLASVKVSRKLVDLPWMERLFFLVLDSDTQFNEAMANLTNRRVAGIPGAIICGNSAYLLARFAGCNPITFCGCDMSMPEPSKNPRDINYEAQGLDGEKIYSLPGYLAGHEWLLRHLHLDNEVQSGKVKVFNSTEGGIMYGEQLPPLTLREFFDAYPGSDKSLMMQIRKRLDLY
jgi:hypothetical protein